MTQFSQRWFFLLFLQLAAQVFSFPGYAVDQPNERKASQSKSGNQEQMMKNGPCSSDIQSYCSDVTPGKGRILACLKAHEDKLSTACLHHEQAMISQFRKVRRACQKDMQKYCKDVKPGGGEVMKCLKQHESELTQSCKNEFSSRQNRG